MFSRALEGATAKGLISIVEFALSHMPPQSCYWSWAGHLVVGEGDGEVGGVHAVVARGGVLR
jgi:hypothetical protein